jgi:hypothetical protein
MTLNTTPVLNQIQTFRSNTTAAVAGSLLGAIIPAISFDVAHNRMDFTSFTFLLTMQALIVLACLVFSGIKVYQWAALVNRSRVLGAAFTVILEVTLLFTTGWTAYAAISVLIAINAMSYAFALVSNVREVKAAKRASRSKAR